MIRITAAVIALLTMISSSYAYDRHHYRSAPRHHYRSVAPWIAGGLAVGALGAYAYQNRRYSYECVERFMGYDYYGRRVYQTFCPDY